MKNKNALSLALVTISVAALVLSGCSFVRIQNVSAASVTVAVTVPDSGKAYTREVASGGIVDVFSGEGGRYTITVIPSESYRSILERLQQQITTRLFEERETLTVDEVRQLVENLNHIDRLIAELAKPQPSCSGFVPEFETAVATISYDDFNSQWVLECSSGGG